MVQTLISFSGCAGAYPIHFGIAKRLREIIRDHRDHDYIFAGVSAGCMPALSLALGLDEDQVMENFGKFVQSFDRWWKTRYTHFYKNMEKSLHEALNPDSYKDVSGRLFISVTKVEPFGLKNEIISEFHSNEDLVAAVITSAHLPFLWARPPIKRFRDFWALDGGVSNNLVHIEGVNNICFDLLDHPVALSDFLVNVCEKKWARLYDYGYHCVDAQFVKQRLQTREPSPPRNFLLPPKVLPGRMGPFQK